MEADMSTATVQPERILSELSELWTSLGKESAGEGGETGHGVLRACAMTLVVLADAKEDPADVGETVAALMREHPSRSVVVRVDGGAPLAARVLAQCWMPFGSRRQICCEQIEITASAAEIGTIPALVLPLEVADLPVIVWCRLDPASAEPFASLATKTIIDTAREADPKAAIENLKASLERGRLVADLAWTRLTRWRELIAQVFDNPAYYAQLGKIEKITIFHAGEARPVAAWYLAAWLADCFEKIRTSVAIGFEKSDAPVGGNLCGVELGSDDLGISIGRTDCASAEVRMGDHVTKAVFGKTTDYSALREELGITGRDHLFERVLERAAAMAAETE
jgi:glucose-6-phosphate dehydrogenase assembly protein OpcA